MSIRIAQLTDPHLLLPAGQQLMGLNVADRFERCLAAAVATKPDAYLLTGDFCAHDPDPAVYRWLRPRLENLGRPYYLVAGNHDDRGMLRRTFGLDGEGEAPIYYAAEIGPRRFLFLDSCPVALSKSK